MTYLVFVLQKFALDSGSALLTRRKVSVLQTLGTWPFCRWAKRHQPDGIARDVIETLRLYLLFQIETGWKGKMTCRHFENQLEFWRVNRIFNPKNWTQRNPIFKSHRFLLWIQDQEAGRRSPLTISLAMSQGVLPQRYKKFIQNDILGNVEQS